MQLCIKVGKFGYPKLYTDFRTPLIKSYYIVIFELYATRFHQPFTIPGSAFVVYSRHIRVISLYKIISSRSFFTNKNEFKGEVSENV